MALIYSQIYPFFMSSINMTVTYSKNTVKFWILDTQNLDSSKNKMGAFRCLTAILSQTFKFQPGIQIMSWKPENFTTGFPQNQPTKNTEAASNWSQDSILIFLENFFLLFQTPAAIQVSDVQVNHLPFVLSPQIDLAIKEAETR